MNSRQFCVNFVSILLQTFSKIGYIGTACNELFSTKKRQIFLLLYQWFIILLYNKVNDGLSVNSCSKFC